MKKGFFRRPSIIDREKTIGRSILLGQPFAQQNYNSESNVPARQSPILSQISPTNSPSFGSNASNEEGKQGATSPDLNPKNLEHKNSKLRIKTNENPQVVVKNPLQEMIAARTFLIQIGEKNFKLESEIKSLKKLRSVITTNYGVEYEFDLEYYDQEFEQYVSVNIWSDLPSQRVVKMRVVANQALINKSIDADQIQNETGNELIMCSENKSDKTMKVGIHPINYSRMRRAASDQYVPVISFLGPTGGGKSSLICKFNPSKKPVVALESQPIPTTSNVNSFLAGGFEDIPHIRIMDVEGEDGGLPLMEYCKSEGISMDAIPGNDMFTLSANDVVEFVQSVFERCDIKDLNAYMEARKRVTKNDFTRLSYIVSDVIIYVNTVPPKRESEYLERVLEFTQAAQKGISSAERPALIMVFNQCTKRETPFDIDDSTKQFFLLVDREKKLLESFRTVDFIKLPDWDHTELYKKQFSAFETRLRKRIKETRASKLAQGTLFTESAWFSILEKVVANFESQQLSMSKIFTKFILSESSLVNRAYNFFDSIYGSGVSDKLRFLKCREISIKTLGVYIVMHSKEKGHSSILENHDTSLHLHSELLNRIHRRTPCEAVLRGHVCTQEWGTHDAHRFNVGPTTPLPQYGSSRNLLSGSPSATRLGSSPSSTHMSLSPSSRGGNKGFAASVTSAYTDDFAKNSKKKHGAGHQEVEELLGAHRFDDPYPEEQLREIMLQTIAKLKKMTGIEFYKERLFIFRQGILNGNVTDSNLPKTKCFLCLKNKQDCLLTCSHSFCRYCILEFYTIDQIQKENIGNNIGDDDDVFTIACPLCLEEADLIPNIPPVPGRGGIRILSLDGGGFRASLQVQMLERLSKITGLEVSEMFDLICGVGASGPLALSFLVNQQVSTPSWNAQPQVPHKTISGEGHGGLSLHPGLNALAKPTPTPYFRNIEDQREVFKTLPSLLQKKPLLQKLIGSRMFNAIFGSKYNAEDYERILRENAFGESTDLMISTAQNTTPKVFIVTGNANDLHSPVLLGNYPNARRTYLRVENKYKLWEAARAASATPNVFPFFQRDEYCFVDGSIFTSSPTELSITEAFNIWGYERDIDFVVSMGTGIKSSKRMQGDGIISFLNEVIDLALASEETHEIIKSMSSRHHDVNRGELSIDSQWDDLPLFSYFRLNPEIKKRDNLQSSAKKKVLMGLMNQTEDWIRKNEDKFKMVANIVRSRVFVFDGEGSFQATRGSFATFGVYSRLNYNHQVSSGGGPVYLHIDIEDETEITVEGSYDKSWKIKYVPQKVGLHHCSIQVSFSQEENAPRLHISGSPFIINVFDKNLEEMDAEIPAENYLPFQEFIQFTTFAENPTPVDQQRVEYYRNILDERMEKLGLTSHPNYLERDPDSLMRSISFQLFYVEERYNFVRKSIAGWLTNHPHYKLKDGSMLCEYVSSWDDYCDNAEKEGQWADSFFLLAAAEFFGVKIIVLSSKEGSRFITSFKPKIFKRKKTLFISHWSDFGYGTVIPWTEPVLFKPVSKTNQILEKSGSGSRHPSLSFSPRNAKFGVKETSSPQSDNSSPLKVKPTPLPLNLNLGFDKQDSNLNLGDLISSSLLQEMGITEAFSLSTKHKTRNCILITDQPQIKALTPLASEMKRKPSMHWKKALEPGFIEIAGDVVHDEEETDEDDAASTNTEDIDHEAIPVVEVKSPAQPKKAIAEPKKVHTSISPTMIPQSPPQMSPHSSFPTSPRDMPTSPSNVSATGPLSPSSNPLSPREQKDLKAKEKAREKAAQKEKDKEAGKKKKGWFGF
eukprot:TRINITY_DN563_c0_g5_i1.p1 TRINITY_DN563_c0_g5~~TRINITY_DN563_c0_g5_i1.p1  ORF type:complete len:1789 (+),score=742.10 TRINITY_DN563_c0_g5_i1:214-5580(+)